MSIFKSIASRTMTEDGRKLPPNISEGIYSPGHLLIETFRSYIIVHIQQHFVYQPFCEVTFDYARLYSIQCSQHLESWK